MPDYRSMDTKEVAAYYREDLKKAFPGTKFSVRISRYSMGSSVSVRWVDGPSVQQVEHITGALSFSRFDSSQDLRWTAEAALYRGELVRAGCSVSVDRDYSAAACERAIAAARAANHVDADPDKLSIRHASDGSYAYIVSTEAQQYDPWSAYSIAQQALREGTAYPDAPRADVVAQEIVYAELETARELRDAPIRADIEQITRELSSLGFEGFEATQTAQDVYAVRVPGLTLSNGRPLVLAGSVRQVVGMAQRRVA
ncbi:LPD29 domain-containing protein [Deinococcus sp. Leaf326]|uniref:LPD29 domain-containing protein n=1 Tax=Deinococcus sp. Leaf326 TaxID=1736338 RepID=UPI000701110A|nr:LPD29 domain-containing protein [Deinococcus sp. Leaf326]KQR33102.1 hypothetical protein ASF71_16555 [Deinococcus sp. Leaf326]